eukprot:3537554-Pyramimonas_sp.AAC.1
MSAVSPGFSEPACGPSPVLLIRRLPAIVGLRPLRIPPLRRRRFAAAAALLPSPLCCRRPREPRANSPRAPC